MANTNIESNTLRPLDGVDGLWHVEQDLFLAGGLMHFYCRMVVVRLQDGGLLLHSPVAMDDDLEAELGALGEVRWLLAPNLFHHLHLAAAQRRYPGARLVAVSGLHAKQPGLRYDVVLEADDPLPEAWREDLDHQVLAGMPKVNERVLYHRPSRSVIATDLLFHLEGPQHCKTLTSRLLFRTMGAYGKPAQSRFWRSMVNDRQANAESLRRVLSWDFARLSPAHGAILTGDDARERVQEVVSDTLRRWKLD